MLDRQDIKYIKHNKARLKTGKREEKHKYADGVLRQTGRKSKRNEGISNNGESKRFARIDFPNTLGLRETKHDDEGLIYCNSYKLKLRHRSAR